MGAGKGRGQGRFTGKKCRLVSMFSLTTAFFLVEIIVGYLTNSMALVADSFHMLSDIAALVIAFLSVRMAPKSWSKNTFGWARAEVLGALVNAVFLVALCFSITVESLKRFYEPETIHKPEMILWVGTMGLIVNLVGLCLFHEHGSSHGHSHGLSRSTHSHLTDLADKDEKDEIPEITYSGTEKKHGGGGHGHGHGGHGHSHGGGSASQMNMRGVFLHVMADALGSVIVIISAIIMWQTEWEYKYYVDPGLSIMLVILILRSVWPLLIESALILLQTVPTHIQVDSLQQKLMSKVDGILAVHEFHIWQLAGDRIIASAHIRCLNLAQYMQVAEKVKEFFHNEGIHSTTIQPEFVEAAEPTGSISSTEDCMLACPKGPLTAPDCGPSKCCPPTRVSSSGQFPSLPDREDTLSAGARRPSSVSISAGAEAPGMGAVSTPNRMSAPNLARLQNNLQPNLQPPEESKPDFKIGDGGARINQYKFPGVDDSSRITQYKFPQTNSSAPSSESAPTSMDQEMDSGEDTPMVGTGTKTKTRMVKVVKKQSNV